ncbi:MAG TPA: hypothetical protein VGD17_00140, partial [Chitinophagaceae bacterium]
MAIKNYSVFLSSIVLILLYTAFIRPEKRTEFYTPHNPIKTGADQTEKYLPLLKGKRIGILGNQTSIIGKTHLV